MSKFFVIFAVPNHADDFEITGVFTNEADAATFTDEQILSGKFLAAGRPQHLEMPEIIDLLVRDRLRELAEPIAKLAASVRCGE